jgi:hypothetical protein
MRKLTVFASIFVVTFALATICTFALFNEAKAIDKCTWDCLGENQCHYDETGPLCLSNPRTPYYLYFHPSCGGGPLNCPSNPYWVGCCAKLIPVGP